MVINELRRWVAGFALTLGVLGVPVLTSTAYAASCASTQIISSNYSLSSDWTTNSNLAPCFELRNGADLNLNGFSITCTGACSTAVKCDTSASKVKSTVNGDADHIDISGPFAIGVEDCTDVEDVAIDGAATAVSSNANDPDAISGNRLTNCSSRCIDATMTENSDRITENIIIANGGDGIRVVGKTTSSGPKVDHNLIQRADVGIQLTGSTYMRVEDNVLVECEGSCDPIDTGTNVTTTNNVCETDSKCACELDAALAPLGTCLY